MPRDAINRDNRNGALVTVREFVSEFAKFKHVLVQEKFACAIDTQRAVAKFRVTRESKASQTNPNLPLLLLLLLLLLIYIEASDLKILLCCLHLR
jgi:hypothetical protein